MLEITIGNEESRTYSSRDIGHIFYYLFNNRLPTQEESNDLMERIEFVLSNK